jgi:multiple sugar transport system substrate-binding protein
MGPFRTRDPARHVRVASRRDVLRGAAALGATAVMTRGLRAQDVKATMRLAWWGSDDRHQRTLKLIKLFESRHPGLVMTGEYGGLIGYQDKLSTEFAGRSAPDIMQISDNRESLIAAGRLLQLDPYIANGQLDLKDANTAVLNTLKVGGKLYSIPWGLACGCYFLDTKVFADSKTDLPGPDWSWEDYANTAKKISQASPRGLYGSADIWAAAGTRAFYPFEFFLRQRGKTAFTADGKLGFGPTELTEWFSFWDELRKAGAVPPGDVTALEVGFETSPLVTGRAAMYPINSSIASSLQGLTQHRLVVAPFPSGQHGATLAGPKYGPFVNASMQVYVNADTKYKALSIDFLNAITNDPEMAKIQLMSRGVPLSAKIAGLEMPDISPIEQSMVQTVTFVEDHATPDFVAWPKSGSQIQDLMQRSHQELAFNRATVPQAVSGFFDEAGQIMD